MTDLREALERVIPTDSTCLKYGWGMCLNCRAGFPQMCQCRDNPKRRSAIAAIMKATGKSYLHTKRIVEQEQPHDHP